VLGERKVDKKDFAKSERAGIIEKESTPTPTHFAIDKVQSGQIGSGVKLFGNLEDNLIRMIEHSLPFPENLNIS